MTTEYRVWDILSFTYLQVWIIKICNEFVIAYLTFCVDITCYLQNYWLVYISRWRLWTSIIYFQI